MYWGSKQVNFDFTSTLTVKTRSASSRTRKFMSNVNSFHTLIVLIVWSKPEFHSCHQASTVAKTPS